MAGVVRGGGGGAGVGRMGEGGSTSAPCLAMDGEQVKTTFEACKDWSAAYARLRIAADEQEVPS